MTLRLGGDGAITGCTSLENPDLTVSGLTISGSFDAEKVLVASGTAAAPSYTFSGDTDNGLYYAGTNSIGLSTGGTNAILIDSTGNVGIGTTSPGVILDVAGSNPTLRVRATTVNTEVSTLRLTEDNSYVGAYVKYDGSTNLTHIGTHSAADSNTANDNHAITIVRDTRNVGIGTSSPGALLDLGTATPILRFSDTDTTGYHQIQSSNANFIINADPSNATASSSISFNVDGSERMRIDSSGRLLVGASSSPYGGSGQFSKIFVAGYAGGTPGGASISVARDELATSMSSDDIVGSLQFTDKAGYTFGAITGVVDSTPGVNDYPGRLVFSTTSSGSNSPTIRMTIKSDGNIGIGTTSPAQNLDVASTNNIAYALDGWALAGKGDSSDILFGGILGSQFDTLKLYTSGSERMVIDETGRVRVGNHASYIASTGVFQVANTSGTIVSYVNSESLSDGEHAAVYSRGENTSNVARQGAIGVYKNPSLTNTVGYIFMDQEDGGNSYLWVDNSGILRISGTGTHRGTTSGTVVGTQTSDERLKNIGNTVAYGLAEIKQLQPKQYSLKTDPGTNKLGFIAQEVESIIPEAVFDTKEELEGHEDGDRTKLGMEYVQLIPVLVNAVKELSAENDALKQRLADAGL